MRILNFALKTGRPNYYTLLDNPVQTDGDAMTCLIKEVHETEVMGGLEWRSFSVRGYQQVANIDYKSHDGFERVRIDIIPENGALILSE